jgi:RimJ/RimL family protein N-acetyltransferase
MDVSGRLVRLRAPRPEDAAAVAEVLADPRVVANLAQWSQRPYSVDKARAWISTESQGELHWAVDCIADGAFIGVTGFHAIDHHNRHCSWGIWIGPPQRWGHGYGTEACMLAVEYAFMYLAMEKVCLFVYAGNDRGRRSYEKAGFASEGILRRHYWRDGELIDVEMMAVFRDHPLYAKRTAVSGL